MAISSFTAAGGNSSAARRARAELQFRDRFGRWVEMGRGIKFKVRLPSGEAVSVSGKYVGSTDTEGIGQVFVSDAGNGLKNGFYQVTGANAQEILATLDPEMLREKGIEPGKGADGGTVGERADADIPDVDDVVVTEAPLGWEKNGIGYNTLDGDFKAVFRRDGTVSLFHNQDKMKLVEGWPGVMTEVDRVESGESDDPNAPQAPATPATDEQKAAAKAAVATFDPEGTIAAKIDAGAGRLEVLEELDKNVLWKAAKDDFDTRNYVELPFKYDKERWAEFEPIDTAIKALPEQSSTAPATDAPETPEAPTGDLDALGEPIPTDPEALQKRAAYLNRRIDRLDAEDPNFEKVYEALDQVNQRLNGPSEPENSENTPEIAPETPEIAENEPISDVLPDDPELDEYVRQLEADLAEPASEPEIPAENEDLPLPAPLSDQKIDMIEAYAAGKDTSDADLRDIDAVDSAEQADDTLARLQRLPNSADTVTRPRVSPVEVTPANQALVNAELDPNTTVDADVVMAEVEKNFPNSRRLANGDIVVDSRTADGKRFDVVVRRNNRERFIAYVQETDTANGNARVLRLGNPTHSYTALKSRIERGRKQINKPKPAYWMNRNQEKVEVLPKGETGEFLMPEDAAPEPDLRPAHVSYDGTPLAPGDWVDWTDWRESVNGKPNATYGQVFRGQVRSLQVKDPGHNGKDRKAEYDYSDHVYAVFPEYNRIRGAKKPNSQQRDFVASNLKQVPDQQAEPSEPFFAKLREQIIPDKLVEQEQALPTPEPDSEPQTVPRVSTPAPEAPAEPEPESTAPVSDELDFENDTMNAVEEMGRRLRARYKDGTPKLLNPDINRGGSFNAGIELLELSDGSKLVKKKFLSPQEYEEMLSPYDEEDFYSAFEEDREILSNKVLLAMGVQGITVIPSGQPNEILMDYAPGVLAYQNAGRRETVQDLMYDRTPEYDNARLVGLFDYIALNTDRHEGNWIINEDYKVLPIDHGRVVFTTEEAPEDTSIRSHLALWALGGNSQWDVSPNISDIKFDLDELETLRDRIQRIEDTFANAGRLYWFEAMMQRMDDLIDFVKD